MNKAFMRLYDADSGQGGGGAPTPSVPEIDYDKLASAVAGRQAAAGDAALKDQLKRAGLTGDELTQAIDLFKAKQEAEKPDFEKMSKDLEAANARALNAELTLQVNTIAAELGVAASKVQYLLKMADTTKAVKDGKIDKSKLKESLEAVLKDVPELKGQTENNVGGFKIGSDGGGNEGGQDAINAQLAQAFGVTLK